jgi:hypothetical protein
MENEAKNVDDSDNLLHPDETPKAPIPDYFSMFSINPNKRKNRTSPQLHVPGPFPDNTELNSVSVDTCELDEFPTVATQMSNRLVDAYLNLLCQPLYKQGIRLLPAYFFTELENRKKHPSSFSSSSELPNLLSDCVIIEAQSFLDFQKDPLFIIPICRRKKTDTSIIGHWSLLVVDRTLGSNGHLILFDSNPSIFPNNLQEIGCVLRNTPLSPPGCKHILAKSPRESKNDCGVWMCFTAAAYIRGVIPRLSSSKKPIHNVYSTRLFVDAHPDDLSSKLRQHIFDSIRACTVNKDDNVFDDILITHHHNAGQFLGDATAILAGTVNTDDNVFDGIPHRSNVIDPHTVTAASAEPI